MRNARAQSKILCTERFPYWRCPSKSGRTTFHFTQSTQIRRFSFLLHNSSSHCCARVWNQQQTKSKKRERPLICLFSTVAQRHLRIKFKNINSPPFLRDDTRLCWCCRCRCCPRSWVIASSRNTTTATAAAPLPGRDQTAVNFLLHK